MSSQARVLHSLRRLLVVVFVTTFLMLSACRQPAGGPAAAETSAVDLYAGDPVDNGEVFYSMYCASCHGERARGHGPVAVALATPPPDLTALSARNGGTFPADAVFQHIDGREETAAHGTRQMPVWGNIWSEKDGTPIAEEVVRVRISELVEYLRSIQDDGA